MSIKTAELENKLKQVSTHDAYLVGMFILENKKAALLVIKSVDGKTFGIRLEHVTRLRTDSFLQGNIILDIDIFGGNTATNISDDVAHVFDTDITNKAVLQAIEKIKREELFLIQLNPSYGCLLHCLCENLELVDDWQSELVQNGNF